MHVRRSRALLLFPAWIMSAINSKYYSKQYCYKLIQYVCVVLSTLVILETLATVATTRNIQQRIQKVRTVVTICNVMFTN